MNNRMKEYFLQYNDKLVFNVFKAECLVATDLLGCAMHIHLSLRPAAICKLFHLNKFPDLPLFCPKIHRTTP